jgi:hypothetical protein
MDSREKTENAEGAQKAHHSERRLSMMLKTRAEKRNALLKGRIDACCDESNAWIDSLAAAIKDRDAPTQPLGVIRDILTRGDCPCRAALRLINDAE